MTWRMMVVATVAGAAAGAMLAVAQTRSQTESVPNRLGGKPDLSGVWQVLNTASWDIQDHQADTATPPGESVVVGNEIPYHPEMLAKKQENFAKRMTEDSDIKCYLPGVPRVTYMPYPFQMFQTPEYVSIVYEYRHINRIIPLDGSPHPTGEDVLEASMGDSRGHWEGDTLVVDVANFDDRTWFDRAGNFHSEDLHVVERYRFIDKDHLEYEVTIEDPKVFTRPWKMTMPIYRRIENNIRPLEYDCHAFNHLFQVPEPPPRTENAQPATGERGQ